MRWIIRSVVIAALLVLAPAGAQAEKRVALVIGNSAYRNAPALPNPRNDAAAIADALQKLGFSVQSGFDLDRAATEQMLRTFGDTLGDADVALFYYAGHGLQVDTKNYIVPVDARLASENDLPFEAVDLTLVLSLMERRPRINLVLLDACRDNPLAQNLARSMGASRSTAVSRGLAIAESGIGTLLVYATQPGNVALDGNGAHSPFTQGLLDYIATPDIEVRQMLTRVRAEVLQATGGKQVPWDHSSLTGDFFFVPRGAAVEAQPQAPAADRELAFWESVKDSRAPADFQAYLDQYPGGTFAALARNRLAALQSQAAVTPTPTAPAPARQEGPVASLGLTVAELRPDLRAQYGVPDVLQGLVVTAVAAADSEFKVGDVIVEVDRVAVTTREGFDGQVAAARARRATAVSLLINRGGVFSLLPLPLAD
ncbi:MAG TPA: caspase family protein [Candidatus Angelobacter sp.]|nr:caspase family protein [Candidatus Angelobacter sp.]